MSRQRSLPRGQGLLWPWFQHHHPSRLARRKPHCIFSWFPFLCLLSSGVSCRDFWGACYPQTIPSPPEEADGSRESRRP